MIERNMVELYLDTVRRVFDSPESWSEFLKFSGRFYKYGFADQIMIYAQRPDASACATMRQWNTHMRRWIRRGARGITLLRQKDANIRLAYVFDVSDTLENELSLAPQIWQMDSTDHSALMDVFRDISTSISGKSLDQVLSSYTSYCADLMIADPIMDRYKSFILSSVAFSVQQRCGLLQNIPEELQDIRNIPDNERASVGRHIRYLSHHILSVIENFYQSKEKSLAISDTTVYNRSKDNFNDLQHEIAGKGGNHHGDHLSSSGRLSHPEPILSEDAADRKVRSDEESLSGGISSRTARNTADDRSISRPSSGNRQSRAESSGANDAPAGERGGSDRAAESQRPNEMGGADEHLQGSGGGNHSERTDLRLEDEQLAFSDLLSVDEQIEFIKAAAEQKPTAAFSFSQTDIDHVLRLGGNSDRQRERVVAAFEKQKSTAEIADILKNLYHGGNGIGSVTAWYAEDGIHLSHGKTARYDKSAQVISWESAAERIGQLLQDGQFATNVELAEAEGYERACLAEKFWHLYHDFSEKAREAGYLSSLAENPGRSSPEESVWLTEQLKSPEFRQRFAEEYAAFWTAYQQDRDLLRFHYHKPGEIWENLKDLSLPRTAFSSQLTEVPAVKQFITEDEIDAAMTSGSGFEGGKGRIFTFFQEPHTDKEKVDFLRHEYGIGGRSHALSGAIGSQEDYDGKGLHYKKDGCPDVHFTWDKVSKRITGLIQKDRYLTEQEQAEYDKIQAEKALAEEDALQDQQPDPAVWEYNGVKERHPDDMVLYQMGDFFELYGEDAKTAAAELDLNLTTRAIPGGGRVERCGFPANRLEQIVEQLRDKHDVTISAVPEGGKERQEYSMPSIDHKAEQHINAQEAEFGADGTRVFRDTEAAAAPTIRELHEQYKPLVLAAVMEDVPYRNACGHSDHENAVIEGNAAIRRAVLGSGNMELLRLYSDTPEFRQRLHREIIDETYSKLHELLRPLSDNDIDKAIQDWNGKIESKHAVVRYMKDHAREKDTAAWLAREFDGSDGKTPFAVRPESPEGTKLPWPKVQRRIAQLIKEDRFYTQVEQDQLSGLQHQESRPYQVVVYHHLENGFDEKKEYPTLEEAEKAAQSYVDGTMEPDGFAYDGAAVYDLEARQYLRIYGDYPDEKAQAQIAPPDLSDQPITRNEAVTDFLPLNPDTVNQDLRDVLAHGLIGETDKVELSELLHSGKSNREVALWLSQTYPDIVETMELETGDTTDYRTTPEGIELEVLDAEEKRLAMLSFRWDEVAPLLRGMYARQMDGFGQERPEPVAETPAFQSETVAVYPGDKNNLPYDVVVQTLRTNEPEPPTPAVKPENTLDEVPDEHPVSIQVNGEWQTFPNVKAAEEASYEEYKANLRRTAENFRITDDHLGEGGPKAKFQANVEAIKLLKHLEETTGQATPEQQKILSRYVGWGGLADAFDPDKESWSKEYAQLKELLTPEEYAAARGSTLNAHYTSPTVIKAIYDAVGRMGFETGNILEPSCGVGNFFGMLPEEMRNSRLYGVELDSISGRIAQQLYPKADITVAGFETTDRRDFYDLAIGNVPFGQYQVRDKAYDKLNFSIHNYFFAKALDQVRPGGVVAFVTSRYTMDAKDSTVRRYLAQRAELLGAIRLPNNAFKANAGTEVVSDIIFLQKRDRPLDIVPEWTQTGQTEDGFAINRYFLDHPEMVLGRQEPESTAHGMDYTVNPIEGLELADQLHDAVKYIRGIYQEAELPELGEGEAIDTSIPADPNVKNYSYTVVDGAVYFRENSRMVRSDLNATAEARVKGMVGLRDCVQELIDLQMDAATQDSEIHEKQAELNRLYDDFSAKYGLINDRANRLAFDDDSSYYLLCALEVIDEDGRLERKADMFTKRTIKPHEAVTSVDTASEALAVSIAEKACVDIAYMEQLTGKTSDELTTELQGVIFRVPGPVPEGEQPIYVTADEYLSGNVRRKLRQAQRAAEQDSAFTINVKALTAAQPKDLDASEIEVRLGATWIDKTYIQQFMYETFNTPLYLQNNYGIEVHYSPYTAEWQISGKTSVSGNDVAAYTTYGTSRANAYKILEDSLNLRDVRIYDTIEDADGKERRVLNAKETTLAAQKQQAIRDAFKDWIWKDPERRQTLVRQYNEEMNSTRPREYDGSHITFGGMNPSITLREHQLGAIAHILYGGNTLLAHEVGAGKTFEMVAAAMESKRLGLCQKSLFAVPNHLTEQWASEFLRLYPSANILVTTKRDFEPHNRKKFCARIATGDYDAIIMGHSQFEKIPISPERQARLLHEQIDEITQGIAEVEANGGERFTVKQLERTKKSLESRLEKLQADDRKDDVVTFEQLGVDRLFVDEAHNYKNLFLYTKMRNVAGLSTSDAQKSSDMFAKCRYMDEVTGSRGVIFATGTPVSNSMTELYTMQRYLQYDRLKELGMTHFDCWASRFGETVTALELAPEGTGYRARTRFSKFFNLPELMNLFKEVADIKTADQLNLPTPKVEYHNIVANPTEHQKEMVQVLSERASKVHSGSVDPSQDNMLKITSDGRKLGLDQRIINPLLPDEPGTKVNRCVDNIMQIWRDGDADKLTQLVFCDISTPQITPSKKAAKALDNPTLHALEQAVPLDEPEPVFTVYDDIRQKLIAQGIPANQIAFIHEANTEARKKELFSKVRSGQVRVLLGSTAKMGAGTNVQDRLVALHDLDCPWRPGDLAQRKGRIERQGNQNPLVHVYRYVTEGTFDAYLWQTVENKQKFISQIMTSKSPVRSCDDLDETALSFAEIKALCAGDPRIKERMDLDVEVSRLKLMKADHQSKQYHLEDQLLQYFPQEIKKHKSFIQGFEADLETLAAHPHPEDGFAGMEIRGDTLTDKENAGAALLDACKEVKGSDPVQIGTYRGFTMSVEFSAWQQEYTLLLKGHMKHLVTLGTNPRGNLTRIDNALAQMSQRLEAVKSQLDNLYQQQATAKEEVDKPFPFENDLQIKSARLVELTSLLNIGDGADTKTKDEKPLSLREFLKQPMPPRKPSKNPRQHDEEIR